MGAWNFRDSVCASGDTCVLSLSSRYPMLGAQNTNYNNCRNFRILSDMFTGVTAYARRARGCTQHLYES